MFKECIPCVTPAGCQWNVLDDCVQSEPAPCCPRKEKKMRTETYVTAPITIEAAQQPGDKALEYIKGRIHSIFWSKEEEIRDKYRKLHPKSWGEAKKWIDKGNWRIDWPKEYSDEAPYHGGMSYMFSWGKEEPDYATRDALIGKLADAKKECTDKVSIITDEKARLDALKTFESYKVH